VLTVAIVFHLQDYRGESAPKKTSTAGDSRPPDHCHDFFRLWSFENLLSSEMVNEIFIFLIEGAHILKEFSMRRSG
jgi:hypothetical protein